jgi:hypothetical protein
MIVQHQINSSHEKSLHKALKEWYARPGDLVEVPVGDFVIDVVHGNLLIEIQTRNFSGIKDKLVTLVEHHPVRLVHPIAQEKWIVRMDAGGLTRLSRRKSPKRGRLEHLFDELVSFPQLIASPNFSLEILLIQEEEIRTNDGRGSWRRGGWSITAHRLIGVVGSVLLASAADFRALLPTGLPSPFTNQELADALGLPLRLAQKMTYCLRKMGILSVTGRRSKALLYEPGPGTSPPLAKTQRRDAEAERDAERGPTADGRLGLP